MGMARHGLIFCTRGLGWAAAIAAALFVMGFVVPVLARSLWVYWRGTGTR